MASFWEISDPSNLSYDGIRGYTSDDSDSGPPVESFGAFPLPTGFVHNGAFSNNATNDGRANCSDWTSTSGFGTSVALESIAPSAGATGASWTSSLSTCGGLTRVWCVED